MGASGERPKDGRRSDEMLTPSAICLLGCRITPFFHVYCRLPVLRQIVPPIPTIEVTACWVLVTVPLLSTSVLLK